MKNSLNIYCLQHVAFETPGIIQSWAEKNQHSITIVKLYDNEPLPSPTGLDMLVVMGGPMSFDEEAKYSWMANEIKFIAEVIKNDKCVIGICLGAQFIAKALGGTARHGPQKEIGWFPVNFNQRKLQNLGLDFFPEQLVVFHWHGDTFDIPEGAVHWASTEIFPNQAYIYKQKVIGIQFHFEVNMECLEQMIDNCGHELVEAPFIQNARTIRQNNHLLGTSNALMFKILDYLQSNFS